LVFNTMNLPSGSESKTAVVRSIVGDSMLLDVPRKSCEGSGCSASCGSLAVGEQQISCRIPLRSGLEPAAGDQVTLNCSGGRLFQIACMAYLMPLFIAGLCVLVTRMFFGDVAGEVPALMGALVGLGIGSLALRHFGSQPRLHDWVELQPSPTSLH
jgi:positive regulator of sigma E activity